MDPVLDRKSNGVEWNLLLIAAVLGASLTAGVVDQDSAHSLGRRGKEMPPAVPILAALGIKQPEVCLVDQGRGL